MIYWEGFTITLKKCHIDLTKRHRIFKITNVQYKNHKIYAFLLEYCSFRGLVPKSLYNGVEDG